VDSYVGGPEHTVGHLLYSRFWQKVLFDVGLVSHPEPFQRLSHQGMILGSDGEKMSKSRGNTVNPDDLRNKYGADAVRLYISFLGPMDRDKPWAENGIEGVRRFLERTWRLVINDETHACHATDEPAPLELEKLLHKTIKKVQEDIEAFNLNTAISAMMIFVNEMYKQESRPKALLKNFVQILAPFAPHICEELWHCMGERELVGACPWPSYDPKLVIEDVITLPVQVNGKMRGTIVLGKEAQENEALQQARELSTVQNALSGLAIKKIIYVPGRILNLIAK
jgi:leucyl-tRNA synthetase